MGWESWVIGGPLDDLRDDDEFTEDDSIGQGDDE